MGVQLWLLQLHREVLRGGGVEEVPAVVPIGQLATEQARKLMASEGKVGGVCEQVCTFPHRVETSPSLLHGVAAHNPRLFNT